MTKSIDVGTDPLVAAFHAYESARAKYVEMLRTQPPLKVGDYTLHTPNGTPVSFATLFDSRNELMVIHNMGQGCTYCTLWADGFNGVAAHLANRVPFVLVTPDKPEIAKAFSESRGWTFPILSAHGTTFIADMGFEGTPGHPGPGVSTFERRTDGTIYRVARDEFGPGDPYCGVWHLLELLPRGVNEWAPKYSYPG